jgi:hypothetical protein
MEEIGYCKSVSDQLGKSTEAALQVTKGKSCKSKQSNVKCNNCSKTGHSKANCYSKGGGKEGQAPWLKKKQQEAASVTNPAKAKSETSKQNLTFTASIPTQVATAALFPTITAVVDSGATSHFCPD